LDVQKHLYKLPEDLEERAVAAGVAVSLSLFVVAWLVGGISLYIVAVAAGALVAGSLLLLPMAVFSIERNIAVQDTITFFLHFLTTVEHINLEGAYRGAVENLGTKAYRMGWSKLVTHEFRDIPQVIGFLAEDMRVYSEHLYVALMTLANEFKKPIPDLDKVLEETMGSIRMVSETQFEVFLSKVGLVSVVFVIVPFTSFLLLPVGASFAGDGLNTAFAAAGIVSISTAFLASLYLICYIPPHLSILTREPARGVVLRGCGNGARRDTDKRTAYIVILMMLVSALHPVATLLVGTGLTAYFIRPNCTSRFVQGMRKELWELPVFLRELSFELMRHNPLETALERGTVAPIFRSALRRGKVTEEIPEKTFMTVQAVIERLGCSGTALGRSLGTLNRYISKTQDYRDMVSSKLGDARTNLSFVFWFLPIVVIVSIAVFKFLRDLLERMEGTGGGMLGLGFSNFVGADMNLHLVLAVATLFLLGCFSLTAGFVMVCEDVVYLRKVEELVPKIGLGLVIYGLGGTLLLAF
jgi:hypothetical protein